MPDLVQQVAEYAAANGLFDGLRGGVLLVAVSGGPDSLALLHVLTRLAAQGDFALHVAHLEHGIRGAAAREDAEFVAGVAAAWGLPFSGGAFAVPDYARAQKLSLEDAARRARYRFLGSVAAQVAPPGIRAVVATGHNADDQVETTLLRLLRGAGLRGLAGMRPRTRAPRYEDDALPWPPAEARLIRPLLSSWRREIEAYCQANGLTPRTDASNADPRYTRNRIRREVIPLLEDMKPGFRARTWSMAGMLAEDDAALDTMLDMLWKEQPDAPLHSLSLAQLTALPVALRRRAILRAASGISVDGGSLAQKLSAAHVLAALRLIEPGINAGARTQWPGGFYVIRRGDYLTFSGPGLAVIGADPPLFLLPPTATTLIVPQAGEVDLGSWRLRISRRESASLVLEPAVAARQHSAVFDLGELDLLAGGRPLVLRTRQAGERVRPFGLQGRHRKLQDVFVDAHVPAQWRDQYALLCLPDDAGQPGEVLWIPGVRRSEIAPVGSATTGVVVFEARVDI